MRANRPPADFHQHPRGSISEDRVTSTQADLVAPTTHRVSQRGTKFFVGDRRTAERDFAARILERGLLTRHEGHPCAAPGDTPLPMQIGLYLRLLIQHVHAFCGTDRQLDVLGGFAELLGSAPVKVNHPAQCADRGLITGHRPCLYPSPPRRECRHCGSFDRLHGYCRALERVGIAYDPNLVCDGEFDFESGVRAANHLLDLPQRPTAIFASNDDMAAGVLAVAHDRNIDLPGALSVAGFDDTTLARTVWPPLTTIHQPMAELARTAAEILIAGGDINHRRLPHTLVERASVVPPVRKSS